MSVQGEVVEPSEITPGLVRRMEIKPTLKRCEDVIQRALDAYAEAGRALRDIRIGRLYKQAGYKSFDAYCQERWNWTRQHADRMIAAAEVWDIVYEARQLPEVTPIGVTFEPPRSEWVARELAPLRKQPAKLVQAWTETVAKHGPDAEAKHVRATIRRLLPAAPEQKQLTQPAERTLDDAVNAVRRLMNNGYEPRLLRAALKNIDPAGE